MDRLKNIGLTNKQIIVLSMWYCDGMKQWEIAERMGVTRQAVAKLCSTARKKIKKSGNSLNSRFYKEERPKMFSFDDEALDNEGKIIGWF